MDDCKWVSVSSAPSRHHKTSLTLLFFVACLPPLLASLNAAFGSSNLELAITPRDFPCIASDSMSRENLEPKLTLDSN